MHKPINRLKAFCATGEGGGVDPTCGDSSSKGKKGVSLKRAIDILGQDEDYDGHIDYGVEHTKTEYYAKIVQEAKDANLMLTEKETKEFLSKKLGSGEESAVYYNEATDRVYRVPHYFVAGRAKNMHNFLTGLTIMQQVFPELSYKFEGIMLNKDSNPRAVISMPRIDGTLLSDAYSSPREAEDAMEMKLIANGWIKNDDESYISWIEPSSGVRFIDVNPENFMLSPDGQLIPFDIEPLLKHQWS